MAATAGSPSRRPVHRLRVAVQLLTRVPVGDVVVRDADLHGATAWFPLVGLGVAGIGVAVRAGSGAVLPEAAATVLAVAAMVVVTGAFHEDGLADAVDGLWGGHSRKRRLEIMRDSRIGTFGATALTLSLLLRVALLASLPLADFARAVACGHVLGRAAPLVLVRLLPPARQDGQAALVGAAPACASGALVATVTTLATVIVATGPWAAAPLVVAAITVTGTARTARRRLGGFTGDVLGAANQVVHLASMATVVALAARGLL